MSEALSSREAKELRALATGHTVLAALEALVVLIAAFYLSSGVHMANHRFGLLPELTPSTGWGVVVWSVVTIVFALIVVTLTFVAGRRIRDRRAHSFCLTVAAINCFFFPFGTILGIFTIIVLQRPNVRSAFGATRGHSNIGAWEGTKLP